MAAHESMILPEFLTVEQFAERMGVSRSTVFNWLAAGVLQVGVHVIKQRNVIRILWNSELLSRLLLTSDIPQGTTDKPLKRKGRGGGNRRAFAPESLEL